MRKLIAFLVALAAVSYATAADRWEAQTFTNPGAGDVLWDSGAASTEMDILFCVDATASVAATLLVQHRNAANSANLEEFRVPLAAGAHERFCVDNANISAVTLADSERVRVVNSAAALGNVSLSVTRSYMP